MNDRLSNNDIQKQMILSDNLWKIMFQLSWPAVLAMLLYGLNTMFDAIFVGRFVGEAALAGISLAYPLSQITYGLGSLIGVGAGSALSIALGGNNKAMQKKLIGNVNYLSLITSVLYMVGAWFFAAPLVRMMGGTGEPLRLGIAYFQVTVLGALFYIHGLAGNMIIRAEGKMKSAAMMMGGGLLVNILANYVLIVLLQWGVVGAAIGTNLGMLVYTITGLLYFAKGKASFEAHPFKVLRDRTIIKDILSMGVPSLIMSVMGLIQAIVIFNALSKYGTTYDLAFYGAVFRIYTLLLTPIMGLMRALQPVIGINFGARKNDRVIKGFNVFSVSSVLFMLPFWAFMMLRPQSVLGLVFPNKIFDVASLTNFRVFMTLLPVHPLLYMAMTFFPAINKGKPVALLGMARQLVFFVPVMLVMPRLFGVKWIYLGTLCIDIVITAWVIVLLSRAFKALRSRQLGPHKHDKIAFEEITA